jgi:predicted transcriptional regulator
MKKQINEWVDQPHIKQILLTFSIPKTPRQVEKELGIKKLKLKPFLNHGLIESLNPQAKKGRLYILTNNFRQLLGLETFNKNSFNDWEIIGWLLASPKQRLSVLKSMDSVKRTSEEIRLRAAKYNPCLTRISTKQILKELLYQGLIETEMNGRNRYYWLGNYGFILKNDISIIKEFQIKF